MKRLSSIFILSLLLVHFAGFYVYFVVRLNAIHLEARAAIQKLPEEKLSKLILSDKEFQSAKAGKDEIKWHGKMYDIARIKSLDGRLLVFALQDSDEDNLLSFIKKVVRNAQEDTQQAPTTLNSFFSLVYVQPPSSTINASTANQKSPTPNFYFINFQSISLMIDSPPPRG